MDEVEGSTLAGVYVVLRPYEEKISVPQQPNSMFRHQLSSMVRALMEVDVNAALHQLNRKALKDVPLILILVTLQYS